MDQDASLDRAKTALTALYGANLDRIVLFGSRARGDGRADSDYDLAIFLKEMRDPWAERMRLADLRVDLMDETGAFFDLIPYKVEAYRQQTPFMHEIRIEGRDL